LGIPVKCDIERKKQTNFIEQGRNLMDGDDKRAVRSWCMYDWANSAFATTIMAAVLPAIAMFSIAVLAPILGAMADHGRARKKYLGVFASFGILFTGLLVLVSTGDWLMASIFYIVGRIGFAGGNIFYDALLPHVAGEDRIDQVSAYGYAFGYLGGGLLLALNLVAILFEIPNKEWAARD
jgi:UMF1 family MFS transporter